MLYISGITGHTGRFLFEQLEAAGYNEPIRIVMRKTKEDAPDAYAMFEETNLQIEYAVGNLSDLNFLQSSLVGVDTIIHIPGIWYSKALVQAAIENHVKWCILVHTTGRFSKFRSASEGYKEIEDSILTLRDKIDITIARPTMIYGSSKDRNMFRLITYLSRHKLFPVFGTGKNLMQPVYAKDLARAYLSILCHPDHTKNKEYNLSGKEPICYIDLLKIISTYLNRKTFYIHIPMRVSILAARIYNKLWGRKAIITVEQVLRMGEDKAFSHELATEDFGYDPCSFAEGIKKEIDEFKHKYTDI